MEETDNLMSVKKKVIADGHLDEGDVEILRGVLEEGGMTNITYKNNTLNLNI